MSDWLEHTVQIEVPTAIASVWDLWSDLEQMPRWMNWIHSVTIDPTNPDLSQWKLAANSFEFSWQSRITKLVHHQIIQWESVDGLPNRGAIRFYDRGESGSIVKLSIAYSAPGFLFQLMDKLFLGRIVEASLTSSLARFRDYAIQSSSQEL